MDRAVIAGILAHAAEAARASGDRRPCAGTPKVLPPRLPDCGAFCLVAAWFRGAHAQCEEWAGAPCADSRRVEYRCAGSRRVEYPCGVRHAGGACFGGAAAACTSCVGLDQR